MLLRALLPPAWVPIALAWIEHESGGHLGAEGLERLDERGLFQVSADESRSYLGLTDAEHRALSTDRLASLQAGADLMAIYADDLVASEGIPERASSLPILAKLMHGGGPRYTRDLLGVGRDAGANLASWGDLLVTWKTLASDDNMLADRCLIHVDSADAIRWRARELAAFGPVPVASRGRPFVAVAGGAAALLALTAALRVYW